LLNSRLSLLPATPSRLTSACASPEGQAGEEDPTRVPLLPKLRGEFAEFLNGGSLAHLEVLTPTYQCRFAVRAAYSSGLEAFLGGLGVRRCLWVVIPPSCPSLGLNGVRIYLNPGLRRTTDPVHLVGSLTLPRPPIARCVPVQEYPTCCPSPTPVTASA
jgi:hypothetical protein